MAGHSKAAWKLWAKTEVAAFQLVDFAAAVATEVVVMRLAGNLVAKRLTGHRDGGEPVALQKGPNVAVDGGDAEAADLSLCGGQHLLRREWPVGSLKCFSDRSFLACITRLSGQCSPSNTG